MGNYSKAIGALIGGLAGIAAQWVSAKLGLPVEQAQEWFAMAGAGLLTWLFPSNTK